MTRKEQIVQYAMSFKGKGMENEELKEVIRLAIINGAKWADERPKEPPLPSDVDEAASGYSFNIENELFQQLPKELQGLWKKEIEQTFKAGAEWMENKFEEERLKHCDELTPEDAQLEFDFVTSHLKKYNRTPTFIDAIKYGAVGGWAK